MHTLVYVVAVHHKGNSLATITQYKTYAGLYDYVKRTCKAWDRHLNSHDARGRHILARPGTIEEVNVCGLHLASDLAVAVPHAMAPDGSLAPFELKMDRAFGPNWKVQ